MKWAIFAHKTNLTGIAVFWHFTCHLPWWPGIFYECLAKQKQHPEGSQFNQRV
ncbi:MAG: hypothetical protein WCA20_05405 [Candidatus Sulfotelmatobacter sp.]